MQYVYVLLSQKDGRMYVGCSGDVQKRLQEHNAGRVKSTKTRRPFTVIFIEEYVDRYAAFRQERFYKSAIGKRELKKKLQNYSGIV